MKAINLPEHLIKKKSDANEKLVEHKFVESGIEVICLDCKSNKKRPDYCIQDEHEKIICEVKTVVSLDYIHELGCHLSSLDTNLTPCVTSYDIFKKIRDKFEESITQNKELVKSAPNYKNVPFCIALFIDLYPTINLISGCLEHFDEISALLSKQPFPSDKWEVFFNPQATQKAPEKFFKDFVVLNNHTHAPPPHFQNPSE